MSKMNIRFRDPSSGQMHSVEGSVVQNFTQDNPQSTQDLRNDTNDGQVDVFLQMDNNYSNYGGATSRKSVHLQIDNDQLTPEQAQALAAAVRSGQDDAIKVDGGSRYNVLTIQTDLWNERADLNGSHDAKVSLNGSEDGGVFLSEGGVFSTEAGAAPADTKAAAQALFLAAEATDKLPEGETIFSQHGVSLETKQAALTQITELLAQAPADGLRGNEAAQLRSSAATVLTEMISSLGNEGDDASIKEQAFGALNGLIEGETVGGLKESMIFNAIRVQPGLNESQAEVVDGLRAAIAPTAPPTDAWFADGKRDLNISVAAGHGEGFYDGATEWFKGQGFEVIDEGGGGSFWDKKPRKIQLTKEVNGEEYKVNIDIRHFDNDSFKEIDNDDYDIVAYMGHSNLGNNTRKSVENAPDATGKDKLIFLGLCSGKDNIDRVRETFPEGQLVTTFNSSYFNTRPVNGSKQFTQGEDIKALMQIINGSLDRASWSEINEDIRDKAVGWNHKDETMGNYVTPLDLQMGARFRDIDNDGSAMTLDRHFNLDVLEVRPGPSSSFEARDNGAEGMKLNGEIPHLAAAFANTIDLYNPTFDNFSHKGRIMSDGYFNGTAEDPVVKFETRTENGEKAYVMQVNQSFAHMGEEALRAVTMVEYNKHLASTDDSYPIKDPVERELLGMLTAAASLSYDAGYRDAAVFSAIVDHYDLPEGLKWSDAGGLIDDEHHDYTGSVSMARKWINKLDPATVSALRDKFAGQ